MTTANTPIPSITILLPSGRIPLSALKGVQEIAEEFSLGIYLSTAQNMRLTEVPEEHLETIKQRVLDLGLSLKKGGRFPLPRVCVGKRYCKMGKGDTLALGDAIIAAFSHREHTKPKFKIAVSGCNMCCSSAKTTDMGLIATKDGYNFFVGGKGGPHPRVGKKIAEKLNEQQVIEIMKKLVDYHESHTDKKQRMALMVDREDFPFDFL